MMITGHHLANGYSRYDRIQELKMEAISLVSSTPQLTWTNAMEVVSKKFMEECYVGSVEKVNPQPITPSASPRNIKSGITIMMVSVGRTSLQGIQVLQWLWGFKGFAECCPNNGE